MSTLSYQGSFSVGKPQSDVAAFVRDLGLVIPCIPNVTSYSVDGNKAKVRFKVDLGDEVPIAELRRVTADTEIEVTATEEGARYSIKGRAAGSSIEVELSLAVKARDFGSEVEWRSEASLGRMLAMMRRFVDVDSMVRRISKDTIDGIVKCISGEK